MGCSMKIDAHARRCVRRFFSALIVASRSLDLGVCKRITRGVGAANGLDGVLPRGGPRGKKSEQGDEESLCDPDKLFHGSLHRPPRQNAILPRSLSLGSADPSACPYARSTGGEPFLRPSLGGERSDPHRKGNSCGGLVCTAAPWLPRCCSRPLRVARTRRTR